ncbi:1,4-alpha-glucan branching protein GlgB [Deltaproteobacteria bacterium TL4]
MSPLKLSKNDIKQLIEANHPTPRSLLGFHEVISPKKGKKWVIRVMEVDAKRITLFWGKQPNSKMIEMNNIDPAGLFEVVMPPQDDLQPYQLKITYTDGREFQKYDSFYFSPQISKFDRYLFHEGNHHHIYHKLGAHPLTLENVKGTWFAVWAPNAQRVSVVGNFNQWDGRKHPMQRHESSGIWELFIPEVHEGSIYKYEIKTPSGDLLLKSDPYGFAMEPRPQTASIVTCLEGYVWQDQSWLEHRKQSNPLAQAINIYEVHLGSWKRVPEEENRFLTYKEATEQLIPYVKDMGFSHIELLPLMEHPLDESWGYQVTGYYAITSRYGSPKEFMRFVDRCHQEGIGVIMDWVPGHFPKDSQGLAFFDGSHLYEHEDPRQGEHLEWGTHIFNYGRHEVRNFLVSNALFWFDTYHIDGIRVDAVASMLYLDYNRKEGKWRPNQYGGRENLDAIHFLQQLNATLFQDFPGILSIAEESTAWPSVTHPTYAGGLGFNMKWNMGWMNDTLRYISLDPVFRKYEHHLMTFSMMYHFTENFLLPLSHDEVVHGKGSLLAKAPGDDWCKRANARLYLTYQMAHPGKKLCFMGVELGQWREWSEARSLDWHLLEYHEHQQFHTFCKELNWFYRYHPALFTNDFHPNGFEWIDLHDQDHSVFSFIRWGQYQNNEIPLIFCFNFTPISRTYYNVGVPFEGTYEKVFDSDAIHFGGSGFNHQSKIISESTKWQGRPYRLSLDLPPLSGIVIKPEQY